MHYCKYFYIVTVIVINYSFIHRLLMNYALSIVINLLLIDQSYWPEKISNKN